jgi:hypothetical protein
MRGLSHKGRCAVAVPVDPLLLEGSSHYHQSPNGGTPRAGSATRYRGATNVEIVPRYISQKQLAREKKTGSAVLVYKITQ